MQHINKICLSCIVVLCTLTVCSCSNRASAEYLTNAQLTTFCDAVISTAVLDSPSEPLTDSCISKTRGLNSYLASFDKHDVVSNGLYSDGKYICVCSAQFLNDDQDNIVSVCYRVTFVYDTATQHITDAEVTDYAEI